MTLPRGGIYRAVDPDTGYPVKVLRLDSPSTYVVEAPDGSRWIATLEQRLIVIGRAP